MTVELRPLGVQCNLHCHYCYQNPQRDAGNCLATYDSNAMLSAVEREGGSFTLFGGEALLLPLDQLERIWSWGLQRFGNNGVQTNGTLVTDAHLRLFRAYKVHVGISVDGPGELNDARWAGDLARTREATGRTQAAIERLCREGLPPSLIVTLHRGNATPDKLPAMHDWLRYVESLGVTSVRLHILEVDDDAVRTKYALTPEENLEALLSFGRLAREQLKTLKLDMFVEMRNLLLGADACASCVWHACDPYTTRAVQGVEGSGRKSNCGRTNKHGIDFTKGEKEGFERYLALYQTPQEVGGCAGCRFFVMCRGQCPGTALDGDWRNRSEYCAVWKGLFRHLEEELLEEGKVPLSASPERKRLEEFLVASWSAGQNPTVQQALEGLKQGQSAQPAGARRDGHGDHTDGHGDHTDARGRQ